MTKTTRNNYIFWTVNGSFDYDSPVGNQTEYVRDDYGFSVEVDNNDIPLLNTVQSIGDFADKDLPFNNYNDFYKFVSDCFDYVDEDTEKTEDEKLRMRQCLMELQIGILEAQMSYYNGKYTSLEKHYTSEAA